MVLNMIRRHDIIGCVRLSYVRFSMFILTMLVIDRSILIFERDISLSILFDTDSVFGQRRMNTKQVLTSTLNDCKLALYRYDHVMTIHLFDQ
jgi:hypothetical protein